MWISITERLGGCPRTALWRTLRTSMSRPGWTSEASADVQSRPSRPLSHRTSNPQSSFHVSEGLRQPESQRPGLQNPAEAPQGVCQEQRGSRGPQWNPPPRRHLQPWGRPGRPLAAPAGALQEFIRAGGAAGTQGPDPAHSPQPGLYLHVTQLHAQVQLAVSLSPVDMRRQHLSLHGPR